MDRKNIFLGPMVVLEHDSDIIELLDGQQRLATITILLSAIRDCCKELGTADGTVQAELIQKLLIEKEEGVYALELGDIDKGYFRETIQVVPTQQKPAKTRSQRAIKQAHTYFVEKISALASRDDPIQALARLKGLVKVVQSDLVVACIPVPSERDAFRIFETLNDRGLRLSVPDLLLNHLMREADPASDRTTIRALWNDMIDIMGRRDPNVFLRHMWVSKYGDLKKTDLFTALKEHLKSKNINSLEFARVCSEECIKYVHIIDVDTPHLGAVTDHVRNLLRRLDARAALPLLLSCYDLEKSDFENIVKWLLVFVVRYDVVMGKDSSGMETLFFDLARSIRQKREAGEPSRDCARLVKETLRKHSPDAEQLLTQAERLHVDREQATYLLSRIASRESKTREWVLSESNLEHIYPRNPREDEWGGKQGQELLDPYLNNIGNLTMLGTRLNASLSRNEFAKKKLGYANASEIKMANDVARYTDWTVDSIKDRAKKLMPQIIEIWDFDNPSRV